MKITCQRDALLAAVQAVAAAVPANSTVPALKNIKAAAQDDALTLVAYDPTQGVGIRYALPGVAVHRAGACILPKDQLTQILRESGEPEVALDAGAEAIQCRAGGRYELLSMDVSEFPDFPAFEDGGNYHEIASDVLKGMIRRTAFAADKKDAATKFQFQAVLWEADGGEARLIATDSKRLAVCRGPATVTGDSPGAGRLHLVPLKAVGLLERNLSPDGELVRVGLRANDALFQTGRATIYSSLLNGKFPPYAKLIEKNRAEATQKLTLPVGPFLSRVRQAAIMADDESQRVDMTFEAGRVAMKARGAKTGTSDVALDLPAHAGPATEIAFDPVYLTEFLRAVENEPEVTLEMSTGAKAALFTCGDKLAYMVMPLTG